MNENADNGKLKHSSIKKNLCLSAVMVLIFAALLFFGWRQVQRTVDIYAQGIAAVEAGDYQKAIDLLDEVNTYENATDLQYYCRAVLDYSETDYYSMCNSIRWLERLPKTYSGDLAADVSEFRKAANQTMEKLEKEEQARLAAKEAERERERKAAAAERERELQERLRTSNPWVGMDEKYIDKTALGKHSKCVGNSDYHNYYWHGYFARVDTKTGKVVEVAVIEYVSPKTSSKSGSSHSVTFDGNDYSDAEELYYWQRDDFVDYEEAEDYFNSH